MITKFMMNHSHNLANSSLGGGITMQNKTTLQTHNEILTANEPWHRGSGFTWMLLALAGLVFFLSGATGKSDTVTYTLGNTGQYSANFTDSAGYFSNANSTELGMWANGGGAKEVAVWRDFKTAGDNTGSARSLQVGDTFTITVSATSAFGGIGFSLNDNGTQGSSFANRTSGSRLFVQEAGTGGSWEVNRSGGYTSLDYNVSSTRKDYKFEVAITSESTANVTLTEGTNTKRAYNLSLNGTAGANIDAFSMWLSNDWNGSSNQNIYWKQNTTVENKGEVELGYHLASNATFTAGKITDGLAANSTSTTSANAVKVGGVSGNTVYLASDNTYTGATTINADATAEAQHANAFGSTSAGTTITGGGVLKLYNASGISYAAEGLTVNGTGISDAGALRNVGGNNTWAGAVTLGSNSRISSDAGSLTLSGGISGGSNVLYVGGANATAVSSAISGAGASQDGTTTSLFKDGAGTLTLTGNNSYSGDTRITAGTLTVNSGGNLGDGSSDIYVSSGATVNVNTSLTVDSIRETGTGNGGVIAIGNGATLTVDGANKGTLFQNSISGAGGLTMAGSGDTALGLYGTQSYTGNTTVSGGKISTGVALSTAGVTVSGGTFETTAADILGSSASASVTAGIFSLGGNDTIGSFLISGGELSGSSTLTAATYALNGGTVTANLGAGAATAGSGTTALNGNLNGSLTANGGTVNAAGTIGGNLTVAGGTLNLGSGGRLSAGATANLSSGTLSTGGNETITRLNATGGTLNLTGDTLTVTGTGGNASSVESGVTATGGTISVSGTLDYQSATGSTALSIASGGKLTGAGTTTGALSVGGTLALGNSPGTLNVGATSFLGGGNYEWEINDFVGGTQGTNWDFLNVTGALTISATSGNEFFIDVIGLLPGSNDFVFTNNYSFAIATASGGISGFDVTDFIIRTNNFGNAMTASGYSSGSWSIGLANSDKDLVLSYTGATLNNVGGASAIPEPSSASMLVLGLAAVLAKRRRVG
jgi:autotransporter-associated beta strand protein